MAIIRDFFGSTAEAVNRNVPDATPAKNAFNKIAEPVKSACRNSYDTGSSAVAKIGHTVRTIRLRRTAGDEINCTYEKIPVEEVEVRDGEIESPVKTNSCSYGGAAFAKIEEAVATPLKSACRNSFVTFAMIAEAVNRNVPDATPAKNAFNKIAEPVKSACRNSYDTGSSAVAKMGHTVRTIRLRRTAGDEINCTYEKIPVEEVEVRDGEIGSPVKTNSCSYGGAAFAKIEEAVATPLKSACRNSFVTFATIGYTIRVKGICRIVRWISDDGTKSIIYVTDVAHESEEGNKLIPGDDFGMPLKNESRNVYTLDFLTFARIGYVVRVNGLYRIGRWIKDPNTKSIIISFTTKLARNTHMIAPGQRGRGYKFIPGNAAFFIILSKTLIETIKLSKEKAGSAEMHGKGAKSVSNDRDEYFSAAFKSLKDKLGLFALDEILVFMMKEFWAFMTKEPFLTQFLTKGVFKMEALIFMMREFFVFMMKQLFGNQFFSGIEIIMAVLTEVLGITLFHGSARSGMNKKGKHKC